MHYLVTSTAVMIISFIVVTTAQRSTYLGYNSVVGGIKSCDITAILHQPLIPHLSLFGSLPISVVRF